MHIMVIYPIVIHSDNYQLPNMHQYVLCKWVYPNLWRPQELPHYRKHDQRGRYLASDQNSPIFLEENHHLCWWNVVKASCLRVNPQKFFSRIPKKSFLLESLTYYDYWWNLWGHRHENPNFPWNPPSQDPGSQGPGLSIFISLTCLWLPSRNKTWCGSPRKKLSRCGGGDVVRCRGNGGKVLWLNPNHPGTVTIL